MSLVTCPPYSAALVAALIAAGYDPYYGQVTLLMHMDTAGFVESKSNKTITNTNTTLSAETLKFGTGAAAFNGTNAFLSTPAVGADAFGTGDFTVESWVYQTARNTAAQIVGQHSYGGSRNWMVYITAAGSVVFYTVAGVSITTPVAVPLNSWTHVAVVRISGVITIFLNGVAVVSQANTESLPSTLVVSIGAALNGHALSTFSGFLDDLRITKGVGRYSADFAVPTQAFADAAPNLDRLYDNNVLLMHGDGANNSTTFTDELGHRFFIAAGTPKISTAVSKFGGSSILLDGASATPYLACPASPDFDITSGNFTQEAWVYVTSYNPNASQGMMLTTNFTGSSGWAWSLGGINTFTTMYFQTWNAGVAVDLVQSSSIVAALTLNAWHHVAICKSGSTYYFFVDGIAHGTAAAGAAVPAGNQFAIGVYEQNLSYASYFRGYIEELRINKGHARYLTAFTPAAQALPNTFSDNTFDPFLDQTTLHMKFEGGNGSTVFTDTRGTSLTTNGAPTISTLQSAIGLSSLKLSGSAEYLIAPASDKWAFGSGDFTIETWIFATTTPTTRDIVGNARSNDSNASWILGTDATNRLRFLTWTTVIVSGSTVLAANTWYNVVVARQGTTIRLFLNGVLEASATSTQNFSSVANPLWIGHSGNTAWPGYIDEMRITKGAARAVTAFTPMRTTHATAKVDGNAVYDPYGKSVTALLHFDGANNSTTFTDELGNTYSRNGSPVISTTKSKYGTASLRNPGNGCDVISPTLVGLQFGTGDFTVECWVNFSVVNLGNSNGVFQLSAVNGGIQASTSNCLAIGSTSVTGRWEMYAANTATYSPIIPVADTWYHVALSRVSGVTSMFVDGVALMSIADTTNYTGTYIAIGGYYGAVHCMNGYIDDFRVTKGIGRYRGTFTPPAQAFPLPTVNEYVSRYSDDAYAASVMCHISFDTPYILDTTGKNVVSNNASGFVVPVTQTFAEGGAGQFLGSTTRLTVPAGANFAPGTGDFTVEAWVWCTSAQIYNTDATNHVGSIWSQSTTGSNYFVFGITATSATAAPTILFFTAAGNIAGPALNPGAWNHVATVRRSGVITCYTNGVPGTPVANTTDFNNTTYVPTIGQYSHNSSQVIFAGLLDNIRYTKGVARYNGAFTPSIK